VDFGDLIVRVAELFHKRPDILNMYAGRFRHILVDEFQDTNPAQYHLLRLLASVHGNLCVVGDDDQSIYRWRGAEVDNILDFPKHFKGTKVVRLEQNYRSSGRILAAAHAIIEKNERRAEKKLWTAAGEGEKVRVFVAEDERDEGGRVASDLYAENARGTSYAEMAVFYRANAQSRALEDALRARRIPYRVVRGRSFYDRAEVKDIAAYLRLCVNPRSDGDRLRVINNPPRGIGDTTVEHLRASANRQGLSLWETLGSDDPAMPPTARTEIARVKEPSAPASTEPRPIVPSPLTQTRAQYLRAVRSAPGSLGSPQASDDPPGDRPDALAALAAAAPDDEDGRADTPLLGFLEQLALVGDADAASGGDRVSLMTLHAAKGLEFDAVWMTGLEERVFPSSRSLGQTGPLASGEEDPAEMAEERRLCYVGMTRARKRLTLSLARCRSLFGELRYNLPSRFVGELPPELTDGLTALDRLSPMQERARKDVFYDEFDQRPRYGEQAPLPARNRMRESRYDPA